MNFLKIFLGLLTISALALLSTSQISSCTKTKTEVIHDTTTVTKVDTLVVVDSVYDITDGLVAYYNFNNGNLNDGSGYGNNITFNNATPASDRFGNPNSAYSFDGTSSYMQVSNSPSLNPNNITLMTIFKADGFYTGLCHVNQLLGKGSPDNINGFYTLRFSDFVLNCTDPLNTNNEKFLGAFSGAGGAADTPLVNTGQWYNLIFTYDGITAKIYLNGQLKKSFATSISFVANNHDLFIGRHEDSTYPYFFKGEIDEIRIYNRALPAGAVKQLSK